MSYIEHIWQTGEVITADKLNHLEDGVNASTSSELQVTLRVSDWSENSQSVSAEGVTSNNSVIVSPDPSNHVEYGACGIYCTEQHANSLKFVCTSIPESDVLVNILIVR